MAKEFKRNDKKDFKKKKSFGAKKGSDFKGEKKPFYKKPYDESFSSNESDSAKNKPFRAKKSFDKKEDAPYKSYKKEGFSGEERKDDEGFNSKDKSLRSKKPFDGKDKKPSFERFKTESRPSDFDKPRGKKPWGEKNNEDLRKKRPFAKSADGDTEKPRSQDRGDKKPFAKKPFSKTPFSKKPSFVKKKEVVNPYDLDESDFKHDTSEGEKPRFSKPKKGGEVKSSYSADDGLIRLNKYISNAGICSRREADELIATGVVQVNGVTITEMGYKVKPTDIIKYGGQTLRKERMVYLILNKPKDYITTVDDPEERRTVLELIHGACKERVYPVGRLDRATTGLLMFTNDGDLTKKLTHPKYGVRKIYHITLDKPLKRSDMDKLTEGVELEDGPIKVDEITYVGDGTDKAEVGVELHSGRNRIIRRLFEHLGYNVRKLDRVMFGPLTKKDLARGRWRLLTESEVGMLKMVSAKQA